MADPITPNAQPTSDPNGTNEQAATQIAAQPTGSTILTKPNDPAGQPATEKPADQTGTQDQKPDGDKAKAGDTKKPEGAPEKYADFEVPEGISLDAGKLEKFTGIAKELNLTQENAQKLVSLASEHAAEIEAARQAQWTKQREDWVKQVKDDPEVGGQRFKESQTRAQRALARFFPPSFVEFVELSGIGDNPDLFRGLVKIDQAVSEDTTITGKPAGTPTGNAANILYPDTK